MKTNFSDFVITYPNQQVMTLVYYIFGQLQPFSLEILVTLPEKVIL
tara:strand:- start:3166 stop:3303 length:138 start_codon:yes stop_codon:yes gene_type:complete